MLVQMSINSIIEDDMDDEANNSVLENVENVKK